MHGCWEKQFIKKFCSILFLVLFFPLYALQIETESNLLNFNWTLEKTSGTMFILNEVEYENQATQKFSKAINYSGAIINLEINDFFLIKTYSIFGMLYHPEGVSWDDIMTENQNIYAVYTEETAGIQIPIAYKSTLYPFAGYSYLKLDYTRNYTFLPDGFLGHNIYYNALFGLDDHFYFTKWFQMDIRGVFTPFSFYYPLNNKWARCFELGVDFYFEFQYFGLHLYVTNRQTYEFGPAYKRYYSQIRDYGVTFRIGI